MRVRRIDRSKTPRRRSGLAPLELVLNLPILLLVMALMVIVGHAGIWKARAHTNARQAVWRTLYYRTGSGDPAPRGFNNEHAQTSAGRAEPPLTDYDPFRQFDVVRGPRYVEPNAGKFLPVRPYQFDMRVGLLEGTAKYDGPWPFLRGMPPGKFGINRRHPILDDRWQYRQQGLGANTQRRIRFLYPFDLRQYAPSDVQRYQDAAIAVILNPLRSQLTPLDLHPNQQRPRNYHWERFSLDSSYGNPQGEGLQRRLRDPKIVCSYNPSVLRQDVVNQLVEEIRGTATRPRTPYSQKWGRPGRMTADYLREYQQQRQALQNQLDQLDILPEPDPALRQALEQQIAILDEYISQLEKFRDEVLTP